MYVFLESVSINLAFICNLESMTKKVKAIAVFGNQIYVTTESYMTV
jgi:hypothetical protein